jgi:hypothetical protein
MIFYLGAGVAIGVGAGFGAIFFLAIAEPASEITSNAPRKTLKTFFISIPP